MLPVFPLLAIARSEFLMHWRRRGMIVISLAMIVLPVAAAIYMHSTLRTISTGWVEAGAATAQESRQYVAMAILPILWPSVYVVLALILPVITADAIPRDAQIGTRELLESLPIRSTVYLAGKLLGVWAGSIGALAAAMTATGIIWWLMVGPFDLGLYAQEWVVGAMPLAVLNGGLSALLASGQPDGRRGVLVGIGVAVSSLLCLIASPLLEGTRGVTLLDYANPGRPAIFLYYFQSVNAPGVNRIGTPVTMNDVLLTILVGGLEILLAWLIGWYWLRRDEAS
ncbi:MAG: ABC transporter permease subunit [Anaerolineales bacterium]|nr:ABC transporter permease subunit [Anaerolineales bacterium]